MVASGNKLKLATPKRRHDSASQSLLKTIVLGLEDYCPAAIAALMSRDEAGRARRCGLCGVRDVEWTQRHG
jgi:hypothetical protein